MTRRFYVSAYDRDRPDVLAVHRLSTRPTAKDRAHPTAWRVISAWRHPDGELRLGCMRRIAGRPTRTEHLVLCISQIISDVAKFAPTIGDEVWIRKSAGQTDDTRRH